MFGLGCIAATAAAEIEMHKRDPEGYMKMVEARKSIQSVSLEKKDNTNWGLAALALIFGLSQ